MRILHQVTLENLKKNKVRTLVTIIGIILSVALFTAVTSSVFSLQTYVLEVIKEQAGNYHGGVYHVSSKELEQVIPHEKVDHAVLLQNLGYAKVEGIKNQGKPYIYVGAMGEGFEETMPVHLTDGRFPENSQELLLPVHLGDNGGLRLQLGQELSLSLGQRIIGEDTILDQAAAFQETETLLGAKDRTYVVVGFYERPDFESYVAPGYTALTLTDGTGPDSFQAYLRMDPMKDTYAFMEASFPSREITYNHDLLRFTGNSNENTLNAVLYSMVGILSLIIMFGSVSLIYNAFSISISERTKQYGLLKSIGATRKQIRNSVFFEAVLLSAVGIPLGILLGITGIGLTFFFSKELFMTLWQQGVQAELTLVLGKGPLVTAAMLGLLTVLISAYVPAKKAAGSSPMEAIRQSKDIRIDPKKVKISKLTYTLFGFSGLLAAKNFKRNKRKYRATVVSLFMSIVLFISATSFTAYIEKGMGEVMRAKGYDITYTVFSEDYDYKGLLEVLGQAEGVENTSAMVQRSYQEASVPMEAVTKRYVEVTENMHIPPFVIPEERTMIYVSLTFLEEKSYEKLIRDNGLAEKTYLETTTPPGVYFGEGNFYDYDTGRYITFEPLQKEGFQMDLYEVKDFGEELYYTGEMKEGQLLYKDQEEKETLKSLEEALKVTPLMVGDRIEKLPITYFNESHELKLYYPMSSLQTIYPDLQETSIPVELFFKAKDHQVAYGEMIETLEELGLPTHRLTNHGAYLAQERAMITVVNIFSYGFIILISLIAAANVFNTISTNISLRRREFAMLKAVGMTRRAFDQMMRFESLLYGVKSLLYGLPVAVMVTYLIYRSMSNGLDFAFFLPKAAMVIAVGSVFLVVFATSRYAMEKVHKDNPVEALKNENL